MGKMKGGENNMTVQEGQGDRKPGQHRGDLTHMDVVRLMRQAGDTPTDRAARRLLEQVSASPPVERRSSSQQLGSDLDPHASEPEL